MNRLFRVVFFLFVFSTFLPFVCGATEAEELNDAILYFVNDPQEITFADMALLVDRNRMYHEERGTIKQENVSEFFKSLQEHGVVGAGSGENQVKVAYVVQNQGTDIFGVLVVNGKFEKEKILETLKKRYGQHSQEHKEGVLKSQKFAGAHGEKAVNPFTAEDSKIDGREAHIFPMPLEDRELIVVSTPDYSLFSSAPKGKRTLLRKTLAVVEGRLPRKEPAPNSKVVLTFAPSKEDKVTLEKRIWVRYDQQKADKLSQKKRLKKVGERFRQKVIRKKVEYFVDAVEHLQCGTLTIQRGREGQMTKVATMVTTHQSPAAAAQVKKDLLKHMIKEIKRNDNVQDKFALGNVSITTQGNQTIVKCQLKDSKEQLHVFNLISSYVAKGLFNRL